MFNVKFNSELYSKQFIFILFKQDENVYQFYILYVCINLVSIFSPCYNRITSSTIPLWHIVYKRSYLSFIIFCQFFF